MFRQKALISAAVIGNEFLKQLESQQVADIVACMSPRSCRKGDDIIKEGDDGNELFVIERTFGVVSKVGICEE